MARLTNAIYDTQSDDLGALNSTTPVANITVGNQFGWAPTLAELVESTAYVRKQAQMVVLELPRFLDVLPNPEQWYSAYKAMFEVGMKSFEGWKRGLNREVDEHAFGGGGEMIQETINVTRERTEPSCTWIDRVGRPYQLLLETWLTYGFMDPDTKFALVGTLADFQATVDNDMLMDWNTMTVLVFEPDASFQHVTQAWITANFAPKTTGTIEAKRDLTTAGEMTTLTSEFTGTSASDLGVRYFAQTILSALNITNANPNLRPAFLGSAAAEISANADLATDGISGQLSQMSSNQIVSWG